jgi:pimeloyl-ACP methyl ester carboxylesterase
MATFFSDLVTKLQAKRHAPVVPLPGTPSESVQKISIRNRKHQRIVVCVEEHPRGLGVAIIVHGLGGNKNELDVETMARACRDEGLTVVRFDATNSFGESDGAYRKATVTGMLSDLEDVVAWGETQPWFREPLVLAGYDMGGMCAALFAGSHPGRVAKLMLLAPMVSGELSLDALKRWQPTTVATWKKLGTIVWESQSRPGMIKRLDWAHMEDRLRYDLLANAYALAMPTLLIACEKDKLTPLSHEQMLFDRLPGNHALYVLKNAHHRLRHEAHFAKLYEVTRAWLREGTLSMYL